MDTQPNTPRSRSLGARVTSLCLLALNVVGLLAMVPILSLFSAKFANAYAEHNVALPAFSRLVIATPWYGYAAICAALCVLVVVAELLVHNKLVTSALNVLVAVLIAVFLVVYVVALALPMLG